MEKYIGTKQIEAEPMTRGEYNEYRGWNIPADENPADEGYLVKYTDGYISWSPKKQFEDVYSKADDDPLRDTALLMGSKDYKDRFRAEYHQLVIRYEKLEAMLDKWDNGTLNFEPTCPRSVYNTQVRAMTDYIAVLEARAAIEGIDL